MHWNSLTIGFAVFLVWFVQFYAGLCFVEWLGPIPERERPGLVLACVTGVWIFVGLLALFMHLPGLLGRWKKP